MSGRIRCLPRGSAERVRILRNGSTGPPTAATALPADPPHATGTARHPSHRPGRNPQTRPLPRPNQAHRPDQSRGMRIGARKHPLGQASPHWGRLITCPNASLPAPMRFRARRVPVNGGQRRAGTTSRPARCHIAHRHRSPAHPDAARSALVAAPSTPVWCRMSRRALLANTLVLLSRPSARALPRPLQAKRRNTGTMYNPSTRRVKRPSNRTGEQNGLHRNTV